MKTVKHYTYKSCLAAMTCFLAFFFTPEISGSLYGAVMNTVSVRVFKRSVVKSDEIRLGKIAEIKGDNRALIRRLSDIVIGKAPLPGKSRRIDEDYLKIRLKQNGIDLPQINLLFPSKVEISRAFIEISKTKIIKVISEFLLRVVPWDKERVRIKKVCVRDNVVLPEGNVSYSVVPPKSTDFLGTVPLSVLFMVNGHLQKKIWVLANIEVLTEMVVTKKPLRRYQLITEDAIQVKKMYLTKTKPNIVTSREDILGKRTKRAINANVVLRTDYIELPPLVRRGQLVTIIAESDGIKITTLGEVRKRGCLDERIRVMNLESKKGIYARVLDSNTVKVEF
jgi:flagella basal body P-ring formation protein FlgA